MFSDLIKSLTYGMLTWVAIRHIKVSKKLKNQCDTEVVSKEISNEIKSVNKLTLIGIVTLLVIDMTWIVIYID